MHIFVQVFFWIGVVNLVLSALNIGVSKWPKIKTETLGEKVAAWLLSFGTTAWAAAILWLT